MIGLLLRSVANIAEGPAEGFKIFVDSVNNHDAKNLEEALPLIISDIADALFDNQPPKDQMGRFLPESAWPAEVKKAESMRRTVAMLAAAFMASDQFMRGADYARAMNESRDLAMRWMRSPTLVAEAFGHFVAKRDAALALKAKTDKRLDDADTEAEEMRAIADAIIEFIAMLRQPVTAKGFIRGLFSKSKFENAPAEVPPAQETAAV